RLATMRSISLSVAASLMATMQRSNGASRVSGRSLVTRDPSPGRFARRIGGQPGRSRLLRSRDPETGSPVGLGATDWQFCGAGIAPAVRPPARALRAVWLAGDLLPFRDRALAHADGRDGLGARAVDRGAAGGVGGAEAGGRPLA